MTLDGTDTTMAQPLLHQPRKSLGTASLEEGGRADFARMRAERLARCLDEARRDGIDALVLGDEANARYVSGARRLWLAGTRPFAPGCVVLTGSGRVHLMSTWHDGVPAEIPPEDLYGAPWDPSRFVTALRGVPGLEQAQRIGIDGMTPMMATLLASVAPSAELVDATNAMTRARLVKTPDELICIETAVAVAESCLTYALDHLRPGETERGLFGRFMVRLADFGLTIPARESSFCATPRHMPPGELVPRRVGTDRHLNDGDLVACDAGVHYGGYEGGLARTWLCGADSGRQANASQRSLQERWSVLRDALLSACRPGHPAGDLATAYRATGEQLPPIPIVYGVGLGMEFPVVGAGVPADGGATTVMEAGMVLAVQGYLHDEGTGGYLAREMVLVTPDGPRVLTRHSEGPLAAG